MLTSLSVSSPILILIGIAIFHHKNIPYTATLVFLLVVLFSVVFTLLPRILVRISLFRLKNIFAKPNKVPYKIKKGTLSLAFINSKLLFRLFCKGIIIYSIILLMLFFVYNLLLGELGYNQIMHLDKVFFVVIVLYMVNTGKYVSYMKESESDYHQYLKSLPSYNSELILILSSLFLYLPSLSFLAYLSSTPFLFLYGLIGALIFICIRAKQNKHEIKVSLLYCLLMYFIF